MKTMKLLMEKYFKCKIGAVEHVETQSLMFALDHKYQINQ